MPVPVLAMHSTQLLMRVPVLAVHSTTLLMPVPLFAAHSTTLLLQVVFSKDGSFAQELIVDELVAGVDAMSREALGEAVRMVLSSAGTIASLRSGDALGPLRVMLFPLPPMPSDMLSRMEPAMRLSSDDRAALATIRSILDLLGPSLRAAPDMGR
jgi:aarF domain-containing kinase